MAAMIPPAVITVTGDDSDAISKIGEVKTALLDLAKNTTTVRIDGNESPLTDKLALAKTQLLSLAKGVTNAKLGADAAPFWTDIAKLRTELAGMSPADIDVSANTTLALAKIEALKTTLGGLKLDALISSGVASSSKGGLLTTLLGGAGLEGGSALKDILWGSEDTSFLSRLFSPATFLSTIFSAKFGSLGSLAGFGTEHLAITGGALGASALTGLGVGGGTLALGALGKTLIGGGSDSLVSHEVLNNISLLQQGLLTTTQLMAKVGPAAGRAEAQLFASTQKMNADFDKTTEPAQLMVTKIGQSMLRVATNYIPSIAKAAQTNFGIIDKAIQPFEKWLTSSSGGHTIFNTLESGFAKGLPASISAITGGIEHLLRVMADASTYTGKFMKDLANREGFANSAAGIKKTAADVKKLVGDFEQWVTFGKAVGKVFEEIFNKDPGTAKAIIGELTGDLQHLAKFLQTAQGSGFLKELFSVHKSEVLELIKALIPLGKSFAGIYAALAPTLIKVVTWILKAANAAYDFTQKLGPLGKIISDGLGIGILLQRMKLLGPLLTIAGKASGIFGKDVKTLGEGVSQVAEKMLSKLGSVAKGWATSAGQMVASGAKWVAQSVAQVAKVVATNVAAAAKTVASWVASAATTVAGWIATAATAVARAAVIAASNVAAAAVSAAAWVAANAVMLLGIGAIVAAVVVAVVEIIKHWRGIVTGIKDVWNAIKSAWDASWNAIKSVATTVWNALKSFFHSTIGQIVLFLMNPVAGLVNFFLQHWHTIESDAKSVWNSIISFLKGIGSKIIAVFSAAGTWLLSAGKDLIEGLYKGIEGAASKVIDKVKDLGHDILSGFKSVTGWLSPWSTMIQAGQDMVAGLVQGTSDSTETGALMTAVQKLATKMLTYLKGQIPQWVTVGQQLMQGLSQGISQAAASVATAATKAANDAVTAAKSATKTSSPSQVFAELGTNWMLGLVQGVQGGSGKVSGAVATASKTAAGSLTGSGRAGGLGGGATVTIGQVTFMLNANGATPAGIKSAMPDAASQLVDLVATGLKAGAGSQY